MRLFDDSSIENFDYTLVRKVQYLEEDLDYKKIINFIEEQLHMYGATFDSIDYKSAKILLDYAKNNNMVMYNTLERKLLFLTRIPVNIAKRLFSDLGLGNNLEELTDIMDCELYRIAINTFRESIPFTDEEIKKARKRNLEKMINDDELYFRQSNELSRIVGSSNYYDYKEKQYIHHPEESFELSDIVIKNVYRDLFTEYIFNDRYQNISKYIEKLIKHAKENGKTDDLDSIEILQDVFERLDKSGIFIIQFLFERLKDSDISTLLTTYQDKYKQETYSSLVSSVTNFTTTLDAYDEMASRLNECDTYYLDGQEFNAFVRSDVQIDKTKTSPEEANINRIGHSFTYVGKENIQTYKDPRQYLTMIYTGVSEDNIGHVYHDDSWSGNEGSFTISEYYTAKTLLEKSKQYPEIWMQNYENIKPFAILCLDEATDWDYEVAKKHGLSIVILNTNKYERKYNDIDSIGEMRL